VNIYGVPSYKEINPALFTLITFPCFFGMMFGDIGQGLVIFAFAFVLLAFAGRLRNTSLKVLLPLGYFFLLLSLFSIYSGLIYNEYFAISLDLFGSCYKPSGSPDSVSASNSTSLTYAKEATCNYVIGSKQRSFLFQASTRSGALRKTA